LQTLQIVKCYSGVSQRTLQTTIQELLARKDEHSQNQHGRKAQCDPEVPHSRRILQILVGIERDCRNARCGDACQPFRETQPFAGCAFSCGLQVQPAGMKADPSDVSDGNSQWKVPES